MFMCFNCASVLSLLILLIVDSSISMRGKPTIIFTGIISSTFPTKSRGWINGSHCHTKIIIFMMPMILKIGHSARISHTRVYVYFEKRLKIQSQELKIKTQLPSNDWRGDSAKSPYDILKKYNKLH